MEVENITQGEESKLMDAKDNATDDFADHRQDELSDAIESKMKYTNRE